MPTDPTTTPCLSRCVVCGAATPDPEAAFCGDRCTEAWTADVATIVATVMAEVALAEAADRAVLVARRTGLWN